MKVLRSTLVAAVAVIAAACGDKVNIVQPATTVGGVQSVTVAPSSVTLAINGTASFTAAVNADAGIATTVTWNSSDNSKVTVSAAGVATAVAATPGVAVCATSTVDTGKKGCASVVVAAGAGTTPAVVQIASITGAGGLNCPVPVPPNSVGTAAPAVNCAIAPGAQLDVRLNVTANSVALDSVTITVDGVTVAKQSFSGTAAASLISLPEAQDQALPVTVVVSFNIANCQTGAAATLNNQVTCGSTTNKPSWLNGTHAIGARAFGKFSGTTTASASTAAQTINLLFANFSGFIGTMTIAGTNGVGGTGSAVDPLGFKWQAGAATIKAVPVIYTGQTATFAAISFGAFCHAGSTTPILTAAADGSFSATFSATSNTAPSVNGREMAVGAACLAAGEAPTITANGSDNDAILLIPGGVAPCVIGAVTCGGNGFLNAVVNLNLDPAFSARIDNGAPGLANCRLNAVTAPGTLATAAAGTFPANYPDGAILVGNALSGNLVLSAVDGSDLVLVTTVRKNGWVNGAMIASSTSTGSGLTSGTDRVVTACADAGVGRLQNTPTGANLTEVRVEVRAGAVGATLTTINATAAIANFASMAETSTPVNQYKAVVAVKDKLGNTRSTFMVSNVPNDAAVSTSATPSVTIHTALQGVAVGAIGTDPTAVRIICNGTAASGGTCPVTPAAGGGANVGTATASASYGAGTNVAAFDFGVDLTPPTGAIANPLITVVGSVGAPCAGRYTLTGGQPCTVGAVPNTIYTATDPNSPVNGAIGSLFYTANPAPMWMAINRRDGAWTNGLIAGQVSGNNFYCDNANRPAAGPNAVVTTLWLPGSSTSCATWPQVNYNQGRVYAANVGIGTLTQPQDPNVNLIGGSPAQVPYAAGALTFDGYYTQTGFPVDQAGNPMGGATITPISNTVVFDNGVPALGGVAANQPFLIGGGNVNFISTAADRLDIAIQRMALEYGAAGANNEPAPGIFGPALIDGSTGAGWAAGAVAGDEKRRFSSQSSWFWQQDQALNTLANGPNNNPPAGFPLPLGAAPISINAPFSFPVTGLATNYQLTTAGGAPAGALSAFGVLNTALGQVVNQALTPTPIGAGSPISIASLPVAPNTPGSVAIDATGAANHGPGLFFICGVTASTAVLPVNCTTAVAPPAAALVVIPAAGAAGASFAAGGSFTLTAIATGATLVFTNPFSQVAFYAYQNASTTLTAGAPAGCLATTEGWRLVGISTSANVSDLGGAGVVGGGRNWFFSINWTPNATTAPCFATAGQNYRIIAVGIGGSNLAPTSPGMPGTAIASVISPVAINIIP